MVTVINPKVNVLDYGPKVVEAKINSQGNPYLEVVMSPDEIIQAAASITYKDINPFQEALDKRSAGEFEKVKKSLIRSAGAGHASMATSIHLDVLLGGDSSKMVDALFTGARYSSSLMPSGRRIPIAKDQIVVPKSIHAKPNLERLYLEQSEANIELYEKLQTQEVPKQEASKIVQYGHKGGGFMVLPLETIVTYARDFENNDAIPLEGKEIISQLVNFIQNNGMAITYESRRHAPREGCINPGIFSNAKNEACKLVDSNFKDVLDHPVVLSYNLQEDPTFQKRVEEYLKHRKEVFSNPERLMAKGGVLIKERRGIISDYKLNLMLKTAANKPVRVWGEDKRHRAVSQQVEPAFHSVSRAINTLLAYETLCSTSGKLNPEKTRELFNPVLSIPPKVATNPQLQEQWIERFISSVKTYDTLVKQGVPEADAFYIIPRGIKMGIITEYDFENLAELKVPLRLCTTCEPEMRKITEQEVDLAKKVFPKYIGNLLGPKCHSSGFCPEKNSCGKIRQVVPFYNDNFHKKVNSSLIEKINSAISKQEK